jgi:type IV pilus assembly protein PilN
MARINLLPWREELRNEKQRQFLSILGLVAVLGIVVVFAYKYTVGLQIERQNSRNNFLQMQINELNGQIKEIKKLEEERRKLIERMEMITSLQKSRPQVVHIFDEIVRAVPEGLNLNSITRKGDELTIIGSAESAPRITAFMRKIESSPWFDNPRLKDIDSDKKFGAGRKAFSLTVSVASPGSDEQKGES